MHAGCRDYPAGLAIDKPQASFSSNILTNLVFLTVLRLSHKSGGITVLAYAISWAP